MFKRVPLLLLVLFAVLLSSCSRVRKDGPPDFYVDETKVGNAVPRYEHPSRSGNKTYTVRGRTYRILKTSKNYSEVGQASWYGTMFHKRKTSSGERYNMLAMTAAHRTLPLPTYAYVTNLRNGKQVIVKINDRGPFRGFRDNRIIDLSYVAAKKLGIIGRGTANVRVTAIDPAEFRGNFPAPKHSQPVSLPRSGSVYLRIASFNEFSRAERLKKQLQPLIRSASIEVRQHGSWFNGNYDVQTEVIRDEQILKRVTKHLKRLGFNASPVRV